MEHQYHLAILLIFLLNAAYCLQPDQNICQSDIGAHLRRYKKTALDKLPFDKSNVMYYLECVMKCKSIGECLSLNVKYVDDLIVCDLLDGDSRSYSMKYEENSTFYEFTKGADWKGTPVAKNYCEPGSKPVSRCSGPPVDQCICYTVLSSFKPTQQSSTYNSFYSSYGVDGDKTTCIHTLHSYVHHWWMVDFEKEAVVIEMAITNRPKGDWFAARLGDFNIRVGNHRGYATNPLCLEHASNIFAGTTTSHKCTAPRRGRYLYIEQNLPKVLHFCEAVVYGYYLD
eukprot:Seg1783.11 transcript_id=Seg1783.11/GoldUCD/mRNA.D3Y31 product=Fucolectin-6 protein_id=Seg1783.11/GoldUCD/D3Y31